MKKLITICLAMLVMAVSTVSAITILNAGDLPSDWTVESPYDDQIELTEHWTHGQGSICVELQNNTGAAIVLNVVKNIHNNDQSGLWLMSDFHNALLVPDGLGGWKPSSDTDGLFFTGPPVTPDIGPNPNAWSQPNWRNSENPAKDTLDFFAPPGGALAFCQWVTIGFQVTVPAGARFNLDQHPTWVPEPATLLLLSFGGLTLLRKRRA